MQTETVTISGNIVDILEGRIFPGKLLISGGRIVDITQDRQPGSTFIIPGFIDAHVHIESSMLTPSEFARVAVTHGAVACVCDPHEIANVLGLNGVEYMIEDSKMSLFKFFFGAPSCVPATPFETSGASIGPGEVAALLSQSEIRYLSEVMNYPGVISREPSIMEKIEAARARGKRIDGHAPGLIGDTLARYVSAGISTDHEALDRHEAEEKISLGMKILIREGSAAKDLDRLHGLLDKHSGMCMFCSDDKHPDDLVLAHIDDLVRRSVRKGHEPMKALRCACLNPVEHYGLPVGLLRKGDPADFAVVDNLGDFTVLQTFINGNLVAEGGKTLLTHVQPLIRNVFHARPVRREEFVLRASQGPANIIAAADGQLLTGWVRETPAVIDGHAVSDVGRDILKIAVVNRYRECTPSVGLIRGFGLKQGAIASSVAHDSHNIVAVGVSDEDLCTAVNMVIAHRGGLAAAGGSVRESIALPIAGLMSDRDGWEVASDYSRLQQVVREFGSPLKAPFLTLSFMALLVIPRLKMSDKGLFDAQAFTPVRVFD